MNRSQLHDHHSINSSFRTHNLLCRKKIQKVLKVQESLKTTTLLTTKVSNKI